MHKWKQLQLQQIYFALCKPEKNVQIDSARGILGKIFLEKHEIFFVFAFLVGMWFLIYFQLFFFSFNSKSFVCGWCGGTNGRWTPAFLPAPLARDSVSHQNNICNFNKYIWQYPQIHFAISTKTICNFNKYNTRFGQSTQKQKCKRASKLQILHIQNWKGLFGNRLMTEWSLMTNLLQIINRANPSTPLGCQQNNKLSIILLSLPSKESFSEAA